MGPDSLALLGDQLFIGAPSAAGARSEVAQLTASNAIPAGLDAMLAGVVVRHAFVVPAASLQVTHVSNAVEFLGDPVR